ncbi:BTAD domain-containing putative transcriptional regulator [Nonomuraea sp. NPDC050153]|uniref:AfsR/SARP family transcriptional regulator n=1 Tax=Nonomuraea sp. NPDC050153 TaxID=3364359 RepID=UPI00378A0019
MGWEIRFLGPWEVIHDGQPVRLTGRRRVGVLARLAQDAGQTVHAGQLLSDIWGDGGTATATKQLHIVISKLRETLSPELIATAPVGYRLDLDRDRVDALLFARLAKRARTVRAHGGTAAADALFRQALGLWRGGPPLGELAEPWARIEAARLEEERLAVLEDHIDVRLAAGDHHAVAAELGVHVTTHPLRERPAAQLMLALYRAGRLSEALAAYQRTRTALVDELGVEPGSELRRLQQAMLVKEPVLDLTTPRAEITGGEPSVPAELPSDIHAFTARAGEVSQLREALVGPAVIVIDGPGGIGKSALAVHVAHAAAGRFPDGVIYVDLHGSTSGMAPLTQMEALRHLLRSFGLDGSAVPADPGEAAARYRSLTTASRTLIILDNARDVSQVRPLIPAGRGCRTLITSRDPLVTLDNARHLRLGPFADADAATLLARLIGPDRARAEPEAAAQIVRLCGGIPLALRIAAARLAARPDWTPADLATRLADATRRMDMLEYADLAVRASISVSHHHLREEPTGRDAAHLLTLLGLLDLPTHTPAATAALAGWPAHRAEAALERLLTARLLEPAGLDRFRFHDLVGLYAREQAEQDEPADEAAAAVRRVLHHYLATAQRSAVCIAGSAAHALTIHVEQPGLELASAEEAQNWAESERENLLALARQTAADDAAAGLAEAIRWPFSARGWFAEAIEATELALQACTELGDRASILQTLGSHYQELGRNEESVRVLKESLELWHHTGRSAAGIYNDLAITYAMMGRLEEALEACDRAQAITVEDGRPDLEAFVRNNRVHVLCRQGRTAEAVAEARHVVDFVKDMPDMSSFAGTNRDTLADAYRAHGMLAEAVKEYRTAIELQHAFGHSVGLATTYWWLGHTLHDLGREEQARESWRQCFDLLCEARLLARSEATALLAQPVPDTPVAIRNQL